MSDEGKELDLFGTQIDPAAKRPAGDNNDRVTFEAEAEARQTDQMASQIMSQIGQSYPLVGRTIEHVKVESPFGWAEGEQLITLTFSDGGVVQIRGIVRVVK